MDIDLLEKFVCEAAEETVYGTVLPDDEKRIQMDDMLILDRKDAQRLIESLAVRDVYGLDTLEDRRFEINYVRDVYNIVVQELGCLEKIKPQKIVVHRGNRDVKMFDRSMEK